MSNTNTEVLTTAYEKLQGALTQSNTVLPKLEEAVKNADLSNYAKASDLEEKANKTDLQTQAERIDSFTTLADGSTTGDAELIDARTVNAKTYTNLGGAVRAISSGEAIQDNALKIEKLDSVAERINKFNYKNVISGHINPDNGTIYETDSTTYKTSEKIKVLENNVVRIKFPNKQTYTCGIGFYNGDTFISYTEFGDWTSQKLITIPSGVNNIQFSFNISSDSNWYKTVMVTINRNNYENFLPYETFEMTNLKLIDKSISYNKLDFIKKVNLFDVTKSTLGQRLNTSGVANGGVTTNDFVSDYIYVYGYTYINLAYPSCATYGTRICFYDNSKTFISYKDFSQWSSKSKITIPSGCYYIRFDYNITNDNNYASKMMVVGDMDLPHYFIKYEDFTLEGLKYIDKETEYKLEKISNKKQNSKFFMPSNVYLIKNREGNRKLKIENMLNAYNMHDFYITRNGADIWTGDRDYITLSDNTHGNTGLNVKIINSTTGETEYAKQPFNLRVVGSATNPTSKKNVLMIGDSFTDGGYLPCEVKNILVNDLGLTNLNFVGTRTHTDGSITCLDEGKAGATLLDYIKTDNTQGRGEAWSNPFLNSGVISFTNYLSNNNLGTSLDYVVIEVGVNDILIYWDDIDTIISRLKTLINNIHAEFPSCKIFVCGQKFASKETLTVDSYKWNNRIIELNSSYQDVCESTTYKDFCYYVDIGIMFDILYGSQLTEVPCYKGNSFKKLKVTDWLHPSKSGYYMIAENISSAIAWNL